MVIKGIYDGNKVILQESVSLPANTEVEVYISSEGDALSAPEEIFGSLKEREAAFWQTLLDTGLIKRVVSRPKNFSPFTPVPVTGKPVSELIIERRR
jgi:hypothetical protein